jgi:hypothetical protein
MSTDLLVGLVSAFRVTNLCLDIILLLGEEILQNKTVSREGAVLERNNTNPNTNEVGPLCVSVNVHLDNTVLNSGTDFLFG